MSELIRYFLRKYFAKRAPVVRDPDMPGVAHRAERLDWIIDRDELLEEARELLHEWAHAPAFADCADVEARTKAWLKKLEARE